MSEESSAPTYRIRDYASLPMDSVGSLENRNRFVFESRLFSEEDTILKAIQDARAWKAAQAHVKK